MKVVDLVNYLASFPGETDMEEVPEMPEMKNERKGKKEKKDEPGL